MLVCPHLLSWAQSNQSGGCGRFPPGFCLLGDILLRLPSPSWWVEVVRAHVRDLQTQKCQGFFGGGGTRRAVCFLRSKPWGWFKHKEAWHILGKTRSCLTKKMYVWFWVTLIMYVYLVSSSSFSLFVFITRQQEEVHCNYSFLNKEVYFSSEGSVFCVFIIIFNCVMTCSFFATFPLKKKSF